MEAELPRMLNSFVFRKHLQHYSVEISLRPPRFDSSARALASSLYPRWLSCAFSNSCSTLWAVGARTMTRARDVHGPLWPLAYFRRAKVGANFHSRLQDWTHQPALWRPCWLSFAFSSCCRTLWAVGARTMTRASDVHGPRHIFAERKWARIFTPQDLTDQLALWRPRWLSHTRATPAFAAICVQQLLQDSVGSGSTHHDASN